ncbi:hypothetical protein JD276_00030 [Leucobacter sp. CSA1]|uniref:Uncharacterized protein n=1 Tax=Leucobacter chromiisoli TaxID=2796471 RepID=A0A934UTJ4_9MICO|nr:hypothetical protein [Leucobacter chromiisoli]MBK0417426.1 hypothetical protein [Leucobacter chromiisoli]
MIDYPRYVRVVLDLEVEVVDPVAAMEYTFDFIATEDGPAELDSTPEEHISQLLSRLLVKSMFAASDSTGVLPAHVSVRPAGGSGDGAGSDGAADPCPQMWES